MADYRHGCEGELNFKLTHYRQDGSLLAFPAATIRPALAGSGLQYLDAHGAPRHVHSVAHLARNGILARLQVTCVKAYETS